MVANCANPTCNRSFRELSKGRLFLLPPNHDGSAWRYSVGRLSDHCYWLCPDCAVTYTITRLGLEGVVSVREPSPPNLALSAPQVEVSANRGTRLISAQASPRPLRLTSKAGSSDKSRRTKIPGKATTDGIKVTLIHDEIVQIYRHVAGGRYTYSSRLSQAAHVGASGFDPADPEYVCHAQAGHCRSQVRNGNDIDII